MSDDTERSVASAGSVADGRPGLWPADLPPCPQANARSLYGDAVSVAWWQSVQISVARQLSDK
jgi:hypothetical protein